MSCSPPSTHVKKNSNYKSVPLWKGFFFNIYVAPLYLFSPSLPQVVVVLNLGGTRAIA